MFDFQLAPFIIAGLLMGTGYSFCRWLTNLGELRHWKAIGERAARIIEEGCAAQGALEEIFNGVTAGGMPHSKLVQRVADVATNALVMVPTCGHKALNQAMAEDYAQQREELLAARLNAENWQNIAVENEGRAEEAERLLGLANDRLMVEESEEC